MRCSCRRATARLLVFIRTRGRGLDQQIEYSECLCRFSACEIGPAQIVDHTHRDMAAIHRVEHAVIERFHLREPAALLDIQNGPAVVTDR